MRYPKTTIKPNFGRLSFLLLKTSDIFRKAVNCIIRLARDYYKPRFDTEQVSDIKKAPNLFGIGVLCLINSVYSLWNLSLKVSMSIWSRLSINN